jgi:uncharacterized protein YbaP (TraB family)
MGRAAGLTARLALALAALVFAASVSAGERFEKGVLWRVSRPGIAPSYIYGTMHVADPRLAELPAPVRKAFGGADSLVVEYLADGYERTRFLEAATFLDRQTLSEKIGPEDFSRALEALKPVGLSAEFVNKLKPWGVLLNLRAPTSGESVAPDAQLYALALQRRMPLHAMEGVEEQIFVFDEFPMESQIALLKHALAHRAELESMSEQTVQAYLARDLAAIWRIHREYAARHPEVADHHARFTQRVVFDRSVVMAYRMQRQLRKGNAFVTVGALHLYGPRGVLALLEQDGYRARRTF